MIYQFLPIFKDWPRSGEVGRNILWLVGHMLNGSTSGKPQWDAAPCALDLSRDQLAPFKRAKFNQEGSQQVIRRRDGQRNAWRDLSKTLNSTDIRIQG